METLTMLRNNSRFKLLMQFLALNVYLYLLLYEFYAGRFASHYFILTSYTLFIDNLAYFIFRKKIKMRFFSPMITATALFILLNTHFTVLPYLVASTVGILGKYLLRFSKGHVFNPACLGILFVIFLLPQYSQALLKQWTSGPGHYLLAYSLGLFVAFLANRHIISITYFAVLSLLSYSYGFMTNSENTLKVVGPIFGFSIIVFAFHMITDPSTSPQKHSRQFLMGTAIASIDFLMRRLEQPYAPFIALMLVSASRPIIERYYKSPNLLKVNSI